MRELIPLFHPGNTSHEESLKKRRSVGGLWTVGLQYSIQCSAGRCQSSCFITWPIHLEFNAGRSLITTTTMSDISPPPAAVEQPTPVREVCVSKSGHVYMRKAPTAKTQCRPTVFQELNDPKPEYYEENGLRKVKPYMCVYCSMASRAGAVLTRWNGLQVCVSFVCKGTMAKPHSPGCVSLSLALFTALVDVVLRPSLALLATVMNSGWLTFSQPV